MRRIVGIIFIVLAVISTINVVRQLTTDQPARRPGNEAYERGRQAAKVAPLLLFGLGFWLLRGSGSEQNSRRPAQSNRSTPRPPGRKPPLAPHPDLRGGQDTLASNPGLLRINFMRWMAVFPVMPVIVAALALAGIGMFFVKYQVGFILLGTAGLLSWQTYREIRLKCFGGDVCPAEVLSAPDGLVAVYTDLAANSDVPYPVIKIIKQPLHRMPEPATNGMRVATVAVYGGFAHQAAWNDFDPEVINCVVTDPEEINRVMMSIPEEQWQALGEGLTHIPEARIGLYPLWTESVGTLPTLPPVPWWKRPSGKLGLLLAGVCALGFGLMLVSPWLKSSTPRTRPIRPPSFPQTTLPQAPNRPLPGPPRSGSGAYQAGQEIQANWAGGWIPGTIIEPLGGGFSCRVQLEDRRFPHPLVLSTNMLRPR